MPHDPRTCVLHCVFMGHVVALDSVGALIAFMVYSVPAGKTIEEVQNIFWVLLNGALLLFWFLRLPPPRPGLPHPPSP